MEYKNINSIEFEDIERIFKEREGMNAINDFTSSRASQYELNKRKSLEKRESIRRKTQKRHDEIIRLLAGITAAATIMTVGIIHINKHTGKVDTLPESQIQIDYTGHYTNQGKLIYHNEKNWHLNNGKESINTTEVAKDLSLLDEVNRKYALYDITEEMNYGSILVDEVKSKENKRNLDQIVVELGKLVGRIDTNYTNVEGINDVLIRYGFQNYSEFKKACKEQIDLLNSVVNEDELKGERKNGRN